MRFVALEFFVGTQVGVGVSEPDHIADGDEIVFHVIQKRTAVGRTVERPAGRVNDQTHLVFLGFDFPQFLDANAVDLWINAVAQFEFCLQLFAEVAAAAFGEESVFGMQFHAGLIRVSRFAVLADAHVTGGHALDRAIVVVEHFRCSEAGKYFNAQRFGLLTEPAHDIAEADDVIAVVLETLRQHEGRDAVRRFLGEDHETVFAHRRIERCALFFPVGQQFVDRARIHHRARKNMRTDLGALLDHADADFVALSGGQLFQADRCGKPGRARAHHHYVIFHRFTFSHRELLRFVQ